MRFKDKIVLVTAAGAGIGRATCDIIGREGGVVCAADNDPARLEVAVNAITKAGGRAHAHPCDALDPTQVDGVIAQVVEKHGRIDILVNGVGGSTIIPNPAAEMDELTMAQWQAVVDFNLNGTFLFTHAAIPHMKRERSGKIVNIASIAGRGKSVASSAAYAAAKGGIIALTAKLSLELGPHGINVNAIAPSMTLTERIRPRWEQRTPQVRQADIERTPMRRMAEASDQARVICFLASEDADFVTGLTIDVTGGL
jgi:NAD(P)-dependent dehydrogenase (short-subunit alcohol dehydrogenase family)